MFTNDENLFIIVYMLYSISTFVFLIYMGKYFINIFTKTTPKKNNEAKLYISSLVYFLFSCIIYSENLRKYILIPITVLSISILIGLLKKEKIAKILYLTSSILFIMYTIYLGWEISIGKEIKLCTEEDTQPIYKDEYYETHEGDFINFNQKFLQYESEKASVAVVKALIKTVTTNNSYLRGEKGKVELIINNDTVIDGTEIPEELPITSSKKYKISFKYNEEGMIYLGEINEINDTNNNIENEVK